MFWSVVDYSGGSRGWVLEAMDELKALRSWALCPFVCVRGWCHRQSGESKMREEFIIQIPNFRVIGMSVQEVVIVLEISCRIHGDRRLPASFCQWAEMELLGRGFPEVPTSGNQYTWNGWGVTQLKWAIPQGGSEYNDSLLANPESGFVTVPLV